MANLPKKVKGVDQEYTWTEQSIAGYRRRTTVKGDVTTFTNTPAGPEEPPIPIEDITPPLSIEIIINHVGDCFD